MVEYYRMKILFWCLAALNLLDYWLTTLILKSGGEEVNVLVNWFIVQFGTIGILYFKAPFLLILGYAIYFKWDVLSEGFRNFAEPMVAICVCLYTVLVAWSVGIYLLNAS